MPRRLCATIVVLFAFLAASAQASAPPVGPLPKGPVQTINVERGELFGIALPKPKLSGQVWRIARHYDGRIVTEVSEGEQLGNIVGAYKALRPGKATIVYAFTHGESTKALQARTFRVTVR
jgi:predicted secreted protein